MTYDLRFESGPSGRDAQNLVATDVSRAVKSMKQSNPDSSRWDEAAEIAALIAEGLSREAATYRAQLETRARQWIELHDDHGIGMTFAPDGSGDMSITYGSAGREAGLLMQHVWKCLEIVARHGYAVFDPQLGRSLDVAADLATCTRAYEEGNRLARQAME